LGSDVICIGNALVDTFALVSEGEIAKAGVEKGGDASVTRLFFDREIQSLATEPQRFTGGSAANTAKGLGRLGCSVSLLARTGDDDAGLFVQSLMEKNGVRLCSLPHPGTTSRVLCLITPDGQRSFLFCGGTSGVVSPVDLNEADVRQTKIVHHDGYILRNKSLLETSLSLCKRWHVLASMDLGAFSLVREHKAYLLKKILPQIDILIGNSDEMHTLFGSDQEIDTALLNRQAISVFLRGVEGCRIYKNGRVIDIPTMPQRAIDSTGAGDLFASGFLYGLIRGWSLEKSATLGHKLAGRVILHLGAEIPSSEWPEIRKTLGR